MLSPSDDVVRHRKAGEAFGVTSICSAHPLALEAATLQASDDGSHVLVEATSNQVGQAVGYTGMRPGDFCVLVLGTAARRDLPSARVLLGGDHLGPNRWRHLAPDEARQNADVRVAAYVAAGFTKIHFDCSFPHAGDPTPLTHDLARSVPPG